MRAFFIFQTFFAKRPIVDVSEYASGSKNTTILDMLLVLNISGFRIYLSQNIRNFRIVKIRKTVFERI